MTEVNALPAWAARGAWAEIKAEEDPHHETRYWVRIRCPLGRVIRCCWALGLSCAGRIAADFMLENELKVREYKQEGAAS